MKNLILGMILLMVCFAFKSQASSGPMAEIKVNGTPSYELVLIKLFAKEAEIPHSPINNYMSALRANPENEGFTIEDKITDLDIVRLESGAGGGTFEVNYLIIIRAGYKSNTFQVGYLKAQAFASEDESKPTTIRISEPAIVTIE